MSQPPIVLIIAPADDAHAQVVQRRIELMPAPPQVIIVNSEAFPQTIALEIACESTNYCGTLALPTGQKLATSDIRSVWWRRPRACQIDPQITEPQAREFTSNECEHALYGFWQNLDCLWVNHPVANQAANRKVHQLKLAQELGLCIPHTLVTNNPQAVRDFWEKHRTTGIIYKQLWGTPRKKMVQTALVTEAELAMLDSVRLAPVIFQECIPAAYDLRVTIIGRELFAARIESQQSQSRLDWRWDHDVPIHQHELPTEIATRLLTLTRRLGLAYGALDLRVTPTGEHVFFEINPSGQFLFVEIQSGWPLSETFAQLLVAGNY